MMNETENAPCRAAAPEGGYRPKFALYHPSPTGNGCALTMDLHPAHDDRDGCIMLNMAPQVKPVPEGAAPSAPRFPRFDWKGSVCVKLDFADLCKMLQVFRGECETLENGRGLYHRSPGHSTIIRMSHVLEPKCGYSLEVYRNATGSDADRSARLLLTPAEALGVALAFENSIGIICFGIPRVVPRDVSEYRRATREMRHGAAA